MSPVFHHRSASIGRPAIRILAVYRHYWPDTTPYARLLRAILADAVAAGHAASVLTAQPSYNDAALARQPRRERLDGVEIRRATLLPERKRWWAVRLLNAVLFLSWAVLHAIWRRRQYDVVLVNCHPPVLIGCAVRLLRFLTGAPYVLHYQDIHPEAAVLAGQLQPGWLTRLLLACDTANCRRAVRIVTLSDDMRRTLEARQRFPRPAPLEIINNFPLDSYTPASELPRVLVDPPDAERPFRVLFAGNMGHFQQLDALVDAAHLLRNERDIHFLFLGAGAAVDELRRQAGDLVGATVFFEPQAPVETAIACMERCDLGVVSLAAGVERVAYPSKTMTYLAAGLPVLANVPADSGLAADLVQQQLGYIPATPGAAALADAIRHARQERARWTPDERQALRQRADALFGRRHALERWSALWRELAAALPGHAPMHLPLAEEPRRLAA